MYVHTYICILVEIGSNGIQFFFIFKVLQRIHIMCEQFLFNFRIKYNTQTYTYIFYPLKNLQKFFPPEFLFSINEKYFALLLPAIARLHDALMQSHLVSPHRYCFSFSFFLFVCLMCIMCIMCLYKKCFNSILYRYDYLNILCFFQHLCAI